MSSTTSLACFSVDGEIGTAGETGLRESTTLEKNYRTELARRNETVWQKL